MINQPKKAQLRQRAATIKRALIEAGIQGMQIPDLLTLARVNEPSLTRNTLAVWIADHQPRAQAVRGGRTGQGYIWYHRGLRLVGGLPTEPKTAPTPAQTAQLAPRYNRAITITLPALPRLTWLRVYAFAVTAYAATLTALEVLYV